MSPINLAAACGPLPSGAELAGNYQGSLVITVEAGFRLGEGIRWVLRVEKPRRTAAGRRGKPERVLLLVAKEGEGPATLLRQLADIWDCGEVPVSDPAEEEAGK